MKFFQRITLESVSKEVYTFFFLKYVTSYRHYVPQILNCVFTRPRAISRTRKV